MTVSAVVRYAAERGFEVPWITPDESIYALLGRSLWETGTPTLLGAGGWGYSLVYPAVIGWPLTLADLALGVELVQALQALAMSATAVVVYLWGREPLGALWALVAAGLSVAIPGLAYSGLLMSETLVYPLTALALAAIATALARPTRLHHAFALAAAALAVLTHVRAAALVPALFLAVAIQCGFERRLEPARRQAPLLAATGALVVMVVAAFALAGRWSDVFGVYGAATGGYELGAAAETVVWHLGGIFVVVAGIPLVALAAMVAECASGRERGSAAVALVATATAWTTSVALEVGIFASRWVEHVAERELLTVAPPLFLVLGLWLRRGVPRPWPWTAIAAFALAAPVVLLPVSRFAVQEAALDAFSFIPLWRLAEATSTTTLEVLFPLAAAALVAAAVFVPPQARAVLPVLVAIVLVGLSVVSTREISRLSRLDRAWVFEAGDPRWLDRAADGPVAYVHGSAFPVGAWKHAFWNRRIVAVARLDDAAPLAPLVPVNLALRPDGGLEQLDGRRLPRLLVTPAELELEGERIAQAPPSTDLAWLSLWRAERPVRLNTWRTGVRADGDVVGRVAIRAYRCGGGRLELTLFGKQGTPLELRANGLTVARPVIAPNEVWNGTIPAPADADGRTTCLFELVSPGLVGSTRLEFVRP